MQRTNSTTPAYIQITVLRDRYVPAPAVGREQSPGAVVAVTLEEACSRDWDTDAHFAAYEAVRCGPERVPVRLDGAALGEGIVARMAYFIGDLDDPVAHAEHKPAREAWRASTEVKLEASGLAWYRTRGGARVLMRLDPPFELAAPADARRWTEFYDRWCAWVRAEHGLELDSHCADFTRLFRLPCVKRDGQRYREPVHGSIPNWRPEFQAEAIARRERTRDASLSADAPEGAASLDPARAGILAALIAIVGDWRQYSGAKFALVGAVGGAMRQAGFTRIECADWVRGWLPAGEPGVDVEHGVRWACAAWEREPHEVSGFDSLARIVGDEAARAFEYLARQRFELARAVRAFEPGGEGDAPAVGEPLGVEHSWLEPDEPIEYVCEGLRLAPSQGKISILAGAPGGGKGPVADHIAAAVALGEPVFGAYAVRRMRVLLLDAEGVTLSKRRVCRMVRGMGREPSELVGALDIFDVSARDVLAAEWLDALWTHVRERDVGLVVLDSYTSAVLASGVDANAPEFATLAKTLGALGVLVLAIAHAVKRVGDGPPRLADIAYSTAFGAMAQTAIVVHYPDPEEKHVVRVRCARAPETGFAELDVRFRDGEGGALTVTAEAPTDTRGSARTAREARAATARAERVAMHAERIAAAVRRLDEGHGVMIRVVRAAAGVSGRDWGDAYAECIRRGAIAEQAGPQGRVLLRVANEAP